MRGTSRAVPIACRQARRWWGHRPQVGEPSSATRRLHAQPSRKYLQTASDSCGTVPGAVRRRARYLVPCTAIVLLGCAARDVGRRIRSGRPARVAHARAALGGARALRRRVGRRAGARDRRAARTPAAGTRCEARAHPAPRCHRPQLARRDQPAGRHLLRRLYVEGDADPIAVLLGARSLPAMLAGLDELERTTHANRGIAAELRARSRSLRAQLVRLSQVRRQLTDAERRAGAALAASERAAASRRATVASIRAPCGCHPRPPRGHRGPGQGRSARLRPHRAEEHARSRASGRGTERSGRADARRAGHARARRRRRGVPPAGQDGQRASRSASA